MQKRRLGEMALDEAEFTPEFFRNTDNIRDLFSYEETVSEIVAPLSTKIQSVKEIETVSFFCYNIFSFKYVLDLGNGKR